MFAQTLVWAAGTGNISLAWLGLVAAKLAGPGWLLGWLSSDGSHLTGLQLKLAGWLMDGRARLELLSWAHGGSKNAPIQRALDKDIFKHFSKHFLIEKVLLEVLEKCLYPELWKRTA